METLVVEAPSHTPTPVDRVVAAVDELPPLPTVMSRLLLVVADADHTLQDITAVVRLDTSLAAATLRLANSARYRPASGDVESLEKAVQVLGEKLLVQLVLVRAAGVLRPRALSGYGYGAEGYWKRSVRTAIASADLAERCGVPSGLAWASGLMIDIGKMVLGQFLESLVHEVLSVADGRFGGAFDAAERHVVGIDHAELGWHLARKWGIPEPIAQAVRSHHHPGGHPDHQRLLYVVHVADAVAAMSCPEPGVDGMRYPLDPQWTRFVPLGERELQEALLRVEAGIVEAEKMMRI